MVSSIDGLVSGLSTSSMISQLMQVEAAPQDKLKAKAQTAQSAQNAYQSVNTKLKAIKTAADAMQSLATWRSLKTESTSTSVTAAATGGMSGMSGSLTFDVDQVARAQVSVVKNIDTTANTYPRSFTITNGSWSDSDADGTNDLFTAAGAATTITIPADQEPTAANIAAAVNAAGLDVRATVVNTDGANGVLQFSGTKTGAGNGFQVDLSAGGLTAEDTPSQSALLRVNPGTAAEYAVSSDTNTFSGLMPGLAITATKKEAGVTVTATSDAGAVTAKMQAMVDAMNAALTEVKTQTAYNVGTKKGSPLTGDSTVREMSQAILGTVSRGLTYDRTLPDQTTETVDFGSLSQFGVGLDRDGKVTFDAAKFTAEYNKDPQKIQQVSSAYAGQVEALADKQSTVITNAVTGRKNEIDSLNDQISSWDVRLVSKREALQKQYSGLEVALGKLQNQSSWLSGQLAGLM
ncbi:flagellar filament capping protein FliD [Actinoplanes hulinensis]|uniref:Flagellar hook-associated protein 2 n=1 Tax=Actinoplanes hulinensis TaxID=1144547 RepID=A0ABS7AWB7_9ACTN|nr:flagellar filament capping protein FliD [Actinoplanes hulinensis]MBW6432982.1 flagellar filament capping protein FliD [Actinoplanes hulinensis]